jgi:hypothetical protein
VYHELVDDAKQTLLEQLWTAAPELRWFDLKRYLKSLPEAQLDRPTEAPLDRPTAGRYATPKPFVAPIWREAETVARALQVPVPTITKDGKIYYATPPKDSFSQYSPYDVVVNRCFRQQYGFEAW